MSRYFLTGSDFLSNSSPPITTTPFSVSFWMKYFTSLTLQQVFNIGTTGIGTQRWTVGINSLNFVNVVTRNTVSFNAVSLIAAPQSTWVLFVGTYAAGDGQRTAYMNGANQGSDSNSAPVNVPNAVRVSGDTLGASFIQGALVAHIGVWGITLGDGDALALYSNPPSYVHPEALLEYWPLNGNVSPEPSFGTTPHNLTVNGTTYSPDDPFYNPPVLMGQAVL